MSVIIEKSVCNDCMGRDTCTRLKRLNPGKTIRDSLDRLYEGVDTGSKNTDKIQIRPGRPKEIFTIIITECSLKNQYKERLRIRENSEGKETNGLYYCTRCNSMHNSESTIGVAHKLFSG